LYVGNGGEKTDLYREKPAKNDKTEPEKDAEKINPPCGKIAEGNTASADKTADLYRGKIAKLLHTRAEILSDIPKLIDFIAEFYDTEFDASLFVNQKWKTDASLAKRILESYLDGINSADFTEEGLHDFLVGLAEKNGLKKGQVLWCVRIAVTGRAATPGGATEMLDLLGKEESEKRIKYAIEKIN
jgi:glutamyl-tRNA synthetase